MIFTSLHEAFCKLDMKNTYKSASMTMIYLTAFPPQSSTSSLPRLTTVLNAEADNMWVS